MDNQNTAKKIIEVDLSNKWPVGSVIVAKSGTGRHRSSALILSYLGNDTVSVSHASGRPTTMQTKTMQAKYRLATDDEASIFRDAAIGPDKDSAMGESKDAVPRGPRKVEPAPVSTEVPRHDSERPSKANDEEPASDPSHPKTLARVDVALLDFLQKQHDDMRQVYARLDQQEQARREDSKALHQTVNSLVMLVANMRTEPATKSPEDAERKAKVEKDERLKAEHKKKFKPLLEEFVRSELELINLTTPNGSERALESGKVYEMFAAWCEKNKKADEKPYQHAIYSLLKSKPHRGEWTLINKADKVLTSYALKNRKQTEFKFVEPTTDTLKSLNTHFDAREVFEFARKVWPNISESHVETITALLDKFTKGQLLTALGTLAKPIPGSRPYIPSEILTLAALKAILAHTAKPSGGTK